MKSEAKRFISIRLSQDEFDKVQHHFQQSTCRSLTEYAKKVLTRQPVIIKIRDQTREDMLHEMGLIRSLMERLPVAGPNIDPNTLIIIYQIESGFNKCVKYACNSQIGK